MPLKRMGEYMVRDVILNKKSIIERCLVRIREVYDGDSDNLLDITKQDSIVLNLQRAVEASIDSAMHIISAKKLGLPQSSRDAFEIMAKQGLIDEDLAMRLKSMVGFRNIAVHDYQKLNLEVIEKIIKEHLLDFEKFMDVLNKR